MGGDSLSAIDFALRFAGKAHGIAESVPRIIECGVNRFSMHYVNEELLPMIESAFIRSHQSAEILLKAVCYENNPKFNHQGKNFPKLINISGCKSFLSKSQVNRLRNHNQTRNDMQHSALYSIAEKADPFDTMYSTLECVKEIFARYPRFGVTVAVIDNAINELNDSKNSFDRLLLNLGFTYDDWRRGI